MRLISLRHDSSLLQDLFQSTNIVPYKNGRFLDIRILAIDKDKLHRYAVNHKYFLKRVLSLNFLKEEDQKILSKLKNETPEDIFVPVETHECDELPTEV